MWLVPVLLLAAAGGLYSVMRVKKKVLARREMQRTTSTDAMANFPEGVEKEL